MAVTLILAAGCFGLCWGTHPDWLMRIEVVAISVLALLRGFADFNPRLPAWLSDPSIRGITTFTLGISAMFVPVNFLVSGWLLGNGIRLMMGAFPETVTSLGNAQPGSELATQSGDIAIREPQSVRKL